MPKLQISSHQERPKVEPSGMPQSAITVTTATAAHKSGGVVASSAAEIHNVITLASCLKTASGACLFS